MGVGTMTGLIAGVVSAVWMLLFLYVINPDFISTMQDAMTQQWEAQGDE
ncbi:MAG: DUF4199 domain-containing protein [Lewinellaceae bacterium]|nr:DUF4199 domain-containing protein [Lewinellaceae bacterium]